MAEESTTNLRAAASRDGEKRCLARQRASIDLCSLTSASVDRYLRWKIEEKECYVAPSPISGNGLYVMQSVKKDEVILEYTGKRYPMAVIEADEQKDKGKYAHEEYMLESYCSSVVIDASVQSASDAKHANHMCEPNCEYVSLALEDLSGKLVEVIFLKAKRPLVMFEEVTTKYEWGAEDEAIRIACACGSKNCLGHIGRLEKNTIMKR